MLNTKQVMDILRRSLDEIKKVVHKTTGRDLTEQIKNSKRSILLYARNFLDNFDRKFWGEKIEESLLHAFSKVIGWRTNINTYSESGISPNVNVNDLEIIW